ncbi:MAG: S8 family serine peptidase [Phycisphaerae bacterium]
MADPVSVLVHFAPRVGAVTAQVAADRRAGVRTWAASVGGHLKYEFKTVLPNAVNLRNIPRAQLKALRAMPGVVKVEEDRVMHAHLTVSTPLIRALQSQITGAGLSADGSGIRVCIIDTGIDSDHIMFAGRIDAAAGRDFANNDNNPEDDNGHGSNVAGIAVGGTGIVDDTGDTAPCRVGTTLQGVAPAATLIGVKVLDSTGSGSFINVIAGIDYCADQSPTGGRADVINLSLGSPNIFPGACDSDSSAMAVNNAVANGVVVVASAGNEANTNSLGSPACASGAIAVGAVFDNDFPNCEDPEPSFSWCGNAQCTTTLCTDTNITVDSLICFSNRSDNLDVTAPGCDIRSAGIAAGGTSFASQCGTSQASPHVAGLAALLLSVDATLTPAEVRQLIRDGAIDMGPPGFDIGYGFGRVDAINSLSLLTPCVTNADCDDGDPCTDDVCSGGSCSNTPIGCPPGQICSGGTCVGQGACCAGAVCSIDTSAGCAASGGTYLGDASVCGGPTIYQNSPGVAIPDGGGAGNPVTDTITVPDSFPIGDVNVDLTITHPWVGDLTVIISHAGTTVTVIDRPGVPASSFGCSMNNFAGIILDDEGTGGAIESLCTANLSSPPNYTPNGALSAFDGMDAAGIWTITAYDSATQDTGTLDTWSLHIDGLGTNPCPPQCSINADCDDGLFCNGAETCSNGSCLAGPAVCTAACEHCDEAAASCALCATDLDGDGTIGTGDISVLIACFGGCYLPADPCAASNLDRDAGGCVGTGDYSALVGCMNLTCATCSNCTAPPAMTTADRPIVGSDGDALPR